MSAVGDMDISSPGDISTGASGISPFSPDIFSSGVVMSLVDGGWSFLRTPHE
jgi:hypothetical protein